MTIEEIITLAMEICGLIGIPLKNIPYVESILDEPIPSAIIFCNDDRIIWIDRHYIAVSLDDSANILYIYADQFHVDEERPEVVNMRKKSKTCSDIALFTSIINQLMTAHQRMMFKNKGFYLLENYQQQIRAAIDNRHQKS